MQTRPTPEFFADLSTAKRSPCISIYMPCEQTRMHLRQNSFRLKNLLNVVRKQLGHNPANEITEFIRFTNKLIQDTEFWEHQDAGLAIFASPDYFGYLSLPIQVPEIAEVSHTFIVTPLIQVLMKNYKFYVLLLNLDDPKIYEGTLYGLTEIHPEAFPRGFREIEKFRDDHAHFQHQLLSPLSSGVAAQMFETHSHTKQEKSITTEYLQTINRSVSRYLKFGDAPLLLAGAPHNVVLYKRVNTYPLFLELRVEGSASNVGLAELYQSALQLIEPLIIKQQSNILMKYQKLDGTGFTETNITEIIRLCQQGKIEMLLVREGSKTWGSYDAISNQVETHSSPQRGDIDLANIATIEAIKTNASVTSIAKEIFPVEGPIAAIIRY